MSGAELPRIPADALYSVEVTCPHCGARDDVLLRIDSQVTAIKGDAKLGAKCTQKKLDHKCGQTSLTIVSETGEIMTLGMDS